MTTVPLFETVRDRMDDALERFTTGDVDAFEELFRQYLWPRMLRRLEEPPAPFGWFEALMAAAVVLAIAAFPELIPVIFYQL